MFALRNVLNSAYKLTRCRYLPSVSYSFSSRYSLDKVYPNSNIDECISSPYSQRVNLTEFTGVIPIGEVDISYSRSSGPGGQNVNKVESKVEVRFNVEEAKWIPEDIKPKLIEQQANKVNKHGYLIVTCEKTRKQLLNQAECLDIIRTMIRKAAEKPYEPTEEDIATKNKRYEKRKREMLRQKSIQSQKKQNRLV